MIAYLLLQVSVTFHATLLKIINALIPFPRILCFAHSYEIYRRILFMNGILCSINLFFVL